MGQLWTCNHIGTNLKLKSYVQNAQISGLTGYATLPDFTCTQLAILDKQYIKYGGVVPTLGSAGPKCRCGSLGRHKPDE